MKILYESEYDGKIFENKEECRTHEKAFKDALKGTRFYDKNGMRMTLTESNWDELYNCAVRLVFLDIITKRLIVSYFGLCAQDYKVETSTNGYEYIHILDEDGKSDILEYRCYPSKGHDVPFDGNWFVERRRENLTPTQWAQYLSEH